MDEYTDTTRQWLDQRFRATDADGVYRAHQPIYGFRRGPTEPGIVKRYTITHRILTALAQLDFDSLLDVGGAEGYKAALVRHLFGVDVTSADLSEEACRRARAIYGIPARSIDIHALPFDDGAFDVVLCSETLEHVARIEDATRELLRVARRAVVITVPREPADVVARNIRERIPHAHIHALDLQSFDPWNEQGCQVVAEPMLDPRLHVPMVLADATPRRANGRGGLAVRAFNAITPLLRAVCGERTARALVALDARLASPAAYGGMVVTLVKSPCQRRATARRAIDPADVIGFAVPFHRVAAEVAPGPQDAQPEAVTLPATPPRARREVGV